MTRHLTPWAPDWLILVAFWLALGGWLWWVSQAEPPIHWVNQYADPREQQR